MLNPAMPFLVKATDDAGVYEPVAQFKYLVDALNFLEAQEDALNTTWILLDSNEYRSTWRRGVQTLS